MLLVSATTLEIQPTLDWLNANAEVVSPGNYHYQDMAIEILITGMGMTAAALSVGRRLADPKTFPYFALQAGIGGALDRSLQLTDLRWIGSDFLADQGAEQADGTLLTITEMGYPPGPPYDKQGILHVPDLDELPLDLPVCQGYTVNKILGSEISIDRMRKKFPAAQISSMEGAAFLLACLEAEVRPLHLRSISNYVEVRDTGKWDIKGAIKTLNEALLKIIQSA
ncbi:MAG: futalosine hydrolase [Saprospiraceae bacterium]